VPSAWRGRILADAASACAGERQSSFVKERPNSFRHSVPSRAMRPAPSWNWRDWLWPAPHAWGALAAVWILLAALLASAPDDAPQSVIAGAPPEDGICAGSLLAWHDAQRVDAELDLLR